MTLHIQGIDHLNSLDSDFLLPLYDSLFYGDEPEEEVEPVRIEAERIKGGADYFQYYYSQKHSGNRVAIRDLEVEMRASSRTDSEISNLYRKKC